MYFKNIICLKTNSIPQTSYNRKNNCLGHWQLGDWNTITIARIEKLLYRYLRDCEILFQNPWEYNSCENYRNRILLQTMFLGISYLYPQAIFSSILKTKLAMDITKQQNGKCYWWELLFEDRDIFSFVLHLFCVFQIFKKRYYFLQHRKIAILIVVQKYTI